MHMIGYFEGIDSERGIAWRCAGLCFSLRDFLRLSNVERVPDHSWLSRTRSRLPHEAHETVFGWVLKLVAERGLVKGERIGVDGSTMEANAALRTIVRRDSGESYRAMLTRMAKESGIDTPSAEDLARFDRKRKGKTLSNADWKSPTDRDARIAKMKDGTTHLAYKPEHAVDLDTGVVVAAPIHLADEGDTTTLSPTLGAAARNLDAVGLAPSEEEPCVVVADKGYHSREQLKALEGGVWKTRIAEPEPSKGYLRWHGDEAARKAVYANRVRLNTKPSAEGFRRHGLGQPIFRRLFDSPSRCLFEANPALPWRWIITARIGCGLGRRRACFRNVASRAVAAGRYAAAGFPPREVRAFLQRSPCGISPFRPARYRISAISASGDQGASREPDCPPAWAFFPGCDG